ncbi:CpaE family protein [Agromyces sp. MMS24-JH15]|uniref:AAA family ATPase n=1 Tax=Agromyces sp. MMS24-JH15 TaxID=3243765 RepID=UPI003748AF25
MARLVLALEPGIEDRLLADLVEHGHEVLARLVGWRDVVGALSPLRPEVVLVGAGRGSLSAELLQACDERGIRLVALAHDDRERAHAAGLGLHEVLDADAAWAEVDRLVSGAVATPTRVGDPPPPAGRARVIAVWGPAGAPGRTLLAINLAAELAASGHRVALVDADPYGGAIAPSLGLLDEAPGFASACRLAGAGALDRGELDRIAQRATAPRAAFSVFTGLIGPSRWPELADERVTAALDAIAATVEYVVVDTGFSLERDEEVLGDPFGPRRNAATFAAFAAADRVIAVGLADPIGLARLLRGHAELAELVDPERVDVVVNRVRASALGIDAGAQVRQTLRRFAGITGAILLPNDPRACDAAILAARPLREAAPRSPLRLAIRDYVDDRVAPAPTTAARARRVGLPRSRARSGPVPVG